MRIFLLTCCVIIKFFLNGKKGIISSTVYHKHKKIPQIIVD